VDNGGASMVNWVKKKFGNVLVSSGPKFYSNPFFELMDFQKVVQFYKIIILL